MITIKLLHVIYICKCTPISFMTLMSELFYHLYIFALLAIVFLERKKYVNDQGSPLLF